MKSIKRVLLAAASGALALGVLDTRASAAERGDSRRLDEQRYSVIWQRSIFLRERRGYQPVGPRRDSESMTRQALSLTGTALVNKPELGGAVYVAYIEDGRSGDTQRLNVGDSVGGGKVLAIGLEYVDFEFGGRTRRITVGMNFDGMPQGRGGFGREGGPYAGGPDGGRFGDGPPTSQPSTTLAGSPPSSSDSGGSSGASVSEIEARMRAKRAQELGKR